jgi:hypothetical protein
MADEQLVLASADIARASPELWRRFVVAFEGHAEQAKEAMIQSPVEALPNAQGHAREAVKLLKTFQNCVATADKIKLKK